jgi:hypothetical protein
MHVGQKEGTLSFNKNSYFGEPSKVFFLGFVSGDGPIKMAH